MKMALVNYSTSHKNQLKKERKIFRTLIRYLGIDITHIDKLIQIMFLTFLIIPIMKFIGVWGLQQNQNRRVMQFAKFQTVSQIQSNVELISQQIGKAQKEPIAQQESPPSHSRSQSTHFSLFSPFAHPSQQPVETPLTPTTPKARIERKLGANPETPKSSRPLPDFKDRTTGKGFITALKNRKASQNNIAMYEPGSFSNQTDPLSQDNMKNFLACPDQPRYKERKTSCNIEFTPSFMKGRKNSDKGRKDEEKELKDTGALCESRNRLVKKKSLGWDQNNNFRFGAGMNSDQAQVQQDSNIITQIPKIENLRKQSENQSPRKAPPSFLTNFKYHRNSIDSFQPNRKPRLGIDNFLILRDLGKGTFGRVVLALQRQTRTIHAIKIMSKREVRETNMVEQLLRQLKIQSFISNPNIIKVHGFFDDLLHFYIIMQVALDGRLADNIRKKPSPPTDLQSGAIMNQICQAVSYLHSQSIIHRDLKPDNILFHQGVIKITDFGWSVCSNGRLRTTFCGTPVYLSPQILMGDEYDQSVDIWTIGAILYEIIYKTNPFRITCKQQLVNILNDRVLFDEKVQVSEAVKDFIQICLRKRAAERANIRQLLLHEFILKAASIEENKG